MVNCTCTNGQGPPPAAKRPGCGDPDGVCPGGFDAGALPRDGCPCAFPHASKQRTNRGCFRAHQCAQAKMRGKVIPCKAAPLILKNDGRFELRGWEGSYLVNGEWVELSDSLIKTRAKIKPGHKIVLRYYGKHGLVEMTYERRVAELGKTSLG